MVKNILTLPIHSAVSVAGTVSKATWNERSNTRNRPLPCGVSCFVMGILTLPVL